MARSLFGGRVGDTVASLYNLGNRQVFTLPVDANGDPSSVTLQVWDAVDGVQLTDLLAADGVTPITVVTVPSSGQVPEFYGPDGVNVAVYVKDPDDDFYRLDARADDAAQVAADAAATAEAAATAAEAVGNTNDTIMAAVAADPESDFYAVQSASIDEKIAEVVLDAADFGTARTHVEINAAIAALPAQGGKVMVRAKDGPWSIGQRLSGDTSAGGIYIDRSNVTLEFDNTVLNLTGASDFIKIRGLGQTPVVVTANVAPTDTTFQVTSSATFAVGQDVFLRLGASIYDPIEPSYWLFAKVTAIPDSTHVTIDRPAGQSLTVASVSNTTLKSITVLETFPQNIHVAGTVVLNNPMTGGANAEAGIYAQIAKNVQVDRVVATNPGAGAVLYQYVDGGLVGSIKCLASARQGGQLSKGRVLNLAECRGVTVETVEAENFEGIPIWAEARTEGCSIGKVVLHNTHPTRSTTTLDLIATIGEATLSIESVTVTGKPSYFRGTGGSAGNYFDVQDAYFYTSARPIIANLDVVKRNLYVDQTRFNTRRRGRKVIRLVPGQTGLSAYFSLPNGIYTELLVYCPSTTGINYFGYGSSGGSSANLVGLLVNGGTAKFGAAEGLGTGYPLNAAIGSKIVIIGTNADGSTPPPAGSYVVVEYDYFPDPAQNLSDLSLFDQASQNPGREVLYASAPPTTGYHYATSITWNTAPAAGGTPGWVCVTSGTPGTWKAMANLAS